MLGFQAERENRANGLKQGPLLKIRYFFLALATIGLTTFFFAPMAGQNKSRWTTDTVFSMMDHSAKDFRSLTADIEHIKYTAVVKDTSTESGRIFVQHDDKMRIEF